MRARCQMARVSQQIQLALWEGVGGPRHIGLLLYCHRLVSRPKEIVVMTNPSFWDILCARTLWATALAGAAPHATADLTDALVTL